MSINRHDLNETMSKVVEHNGVVYVAGNTADDRSVGMKEQTEQVLAKIDGFLAKAGTDKSKLLAATIYVSDMSQKPAMNEAWSAWVDRDNPPTRACVAVELGTPETLVEIVVNAAK
ncbi:MAG: RidA family protein [Rhodospirillaceae bacterium]|jgi:enamine deaminase RidA (YjgF/YER057c/UK114 family)|nr:RidA family protein [Rhodospirillaceae bacterium]MBT5811368.1 RidA family protein [Rhodospirillaceae bacterium]